MKTPLIATPDEHQAHQQNEAAELIPGQVIVYCGLHPKIEPLPPLFVAPLLGDRFRPTHDGATVAVAEPHAPLFEFLHPGLGDSILAFEGLDVAALLLGGLERLVVDSGQIDPKLMRLDLGVELEDLVVEFAEMFAQLRSAGTFDRQCVLDPLQLLLLDVEALKVLVDRVELDGDPAAAGSRC